LDAAHRVVLERTISRAKLVEPFATMQPCTIGLEACSGAHQLARELTALGRRVRIIAAKFVAPHRTSYVQCAKALLAVAPWPHGHLSRWALALRAPRGFGKAVVAVAAKLARIASAILAKGERLRVQGLVPGASL
jgi:hypothetical protein